MDYGAVAGCEGAAGGGVLHVGEVLQVVALAELIVAVGVAVVHEDVLVTTDEGEHAGALGGVLAGLLQVTVLHLVGAGEGLAHGTHHTLTCPEVAFLVEYGTAFVLEEEHILLVLGIVDDVAVDSCSAEIEEKLMAALKK